MTAGPARRRNVALALLVAATALLNVAAAPADQTDPGLDALFGRLANAPNGRLAAAVEQEIWRAWFDHDEATARELLVEARERAQAGDVTAAAARFDALLDAYPRFAEAWNQRAILRYLGGDVEGSLADIERTLALEPRHFGALSGRGQCLLRLERYREAAEAFEAALAVNPWLDSVRMQLEMIEPLLNAAPAAI